MEARDLLRELAEAKLPNFAAEMPLTRKAIRFAGRLHRGQRRASDQAPFILHPIEVALSLSSFGCPDWVVAAGVLHDVIEATDAAIEQIGHDFGPCVAGLVSSLTEDETIADPLARKAALRERVKADGAEAALVFAADKLSKVPEEMEGQLDHYIASLRMLEETIPEHPIVPQIRAELEALHVS